MSSTPPTTRDWGWTGPGHGRAHDLAVLTVGGLTGWWDEHGNPAPWPDDFLDPDSGWQPAGGDTTTDHTTTL